MIIQVNTDAHVDGNERMVAYVSTTIKQALGRFSEHITRVEAHLSDENAAKTGQKDQRCMLEARLENRKPVAVTEFAATQEQAITGAVQKLERLLDSTLGRVQSGRDKATIRTLSAAESEPVNPAEPSEPSEPDQS